MIYRVRWLQSVLDELTERWIEAESGTRTDLIAAANSFDYHLERDPHACSESWDRGGESVTFAEPLGALIEIDDSGQVVWVLSVWRFQ